MISSTSGQAQRRLTRKSKITHLYYGFMFLTLHWPCARNKSRHVDDHKMALTVFAQALLASGGTSLGHKHTTASSDSLHSRACVFDSPPSTSWANSCRFLSPSKNWPPKHPAAEPKQISSTLQLTVSESVWEWNFIEKSGTCHASTVSSSSSQSSSSCTDKSSNQGLAIETLTVTTTCASLAWVDYESKKNFLTFFACWVETSWTRRRRPSCSAPRHTRTRARSLTRSPFFHSMATTIRAPHGGYMYSSLSSHSCGIRVRTPHKNIDWEKKWKAGETSWVLHVFLPVQLFTFFARKAVLFYFFFSTFTFWFVAWTTSSSPQ